MRPPNHLFLLLVGSAAISHAFHVPSAPFTSRSRVHVQQEISRVQPLGMIRKAKKPAKGRPSSGGGFGGGASSASSGSGSSATAIQKPPAWSSRFSFAGDLRPGGQSPQKVVIDPEIIIPDYAEDGTPKNARPMLPWVIEVKTPEQIEKMRASGKLARTVLDLAGRAVRPGITTGEIDELVHQATVEVSICVCELICYVLLLVCCIFVGAGLCCAVPVLYLCLLVGFIIKLTFAISVYFFC